MINPHEIRKEFPIFKDNKTIYLDNAATTYKPQCVIDAVNKYLIHDTANAHRGDYDTAYRVDQIIDETRSLTREFINAESDNEIVFTNGTTMSLNMVAFGYAFKFLKKGDEILLTYAEHASNTIPWYEVSKRTGAVIKFIALDKKGRVTAENLKEVITPKTKIVSLAHVTNVLGYINDIKSISKVVHEYGALLVVDGAQSVPHLKVDVQEMGIDFLAFSGHKMLGPTGIGILYGRLELLEAMDAFHGGGGMNATFDPDGSLAYFGPPLKFEAGTLNLESIYGFNAAIKYIKKIGIENIAKHEVMLRNYAVEKLAKNENIIIYNKDAETGIITFNVKDVFAQDAASYYNSKGIAVRSGQHCAKNLKHFLNTPATIRISIYIYNTKEEIDQFLEVTEGVENYLDAFFD
ncbi:MAG TPA: cysteine desulfurase [Bacilli bacterium]|nr:cysteine desulfurase [Bacilli bacterium]